MARKSKPKISADQRAINLALRIEYEKNRYNWLNPPMPSSAEILAQHTALNKARVMMDQERARAVGIVPPPPKSKLKRHRGAPKSTLIIEALREIHSPHGVVPKGIRPHVTEKAVNDRLAPETAHRKTIGGVVKKLREKFGVK